MKVEVIKRFADKETKKIHEVGEEIEVSEKRYKELTRFVKKAKVKKQTKKK